MRVARTALVMLLAFTLVTSGAGITGTEPVGTARAQSFQDCDIGDSLIVAILRGIFDPNNEDECRLNAEDTVTTELRENVRTANGDNIYTAGKGVQQSYNELNSTWTTLDRNTRTTMFAKGQAAAVEAMNSGATLADSKAASEQAIDDYISALQIERVRAWNVDADEIAYLSNISVASGIEDPAKAGRPLLYFDRRLVTYGDDYSYEWGVHSKGTKVVTLGNGSTVISTTLEIGVNHQYSSNDGLNRVFWNPWTASSWTINPSGQVAYSTALDGITVGAYGANTSYVIYDDKAYKRAFDNAALSGSQAKANVNVWLDGVYTDYNNGNLTATDILNPTTLGQEYATDYESTGYYLYAYGALASAGFEVTDINATGYMVVETDSGTFEGLIASQSAPNNGTWETGITYSASAIPGTQYLVRADGGGIMELEGSFTILEMYDTNGNAITSTTTESFDPATSNTTQYLSYVDALRAFDAGIEDRVPVDGGGGGSGGEIPSTLFGFPSWLVAGAALFAALIIGLVRG